MSAIARDDPAPARIQCAACGDWLPASAYRVRMYNKSCKDGTKQVAYRMHRCRQCERDYAAHRYGREKGAMKWARLARVVGRVGVPRVPLTPLPGGGFRAYDYRGRWLADGAGALEIIQTLYQKARKTPETSER